MAKKGFKLIDAEMHVMEPVDLWERYIDPEFADRAPRRLSERLAITDVFVVVTGNNERQVEAIVDAVEEKLRQNGHKPTRREGRRDGRWVLLDYGDIVVHVQHAEERVFYALERLWKDCPAIPFVDAATGG